MSSQRRRSVVHHPVIANISCGSRLSKLYTLFSPSSSSSSSSMKQRILNSPSSSSPSATTSTSNLESFSATFEDSLPEILAASSQRGNKKKDKERVVEKIVAVVMESSDPYTDFRDSMLLLMVEEEMCEWEDLLELLRRLLSLNSPDHHHIILRAFTEIWNDVFLQAVAVEVARRLRRKQLKAPDAGGS